MEWVKEWKRELGCVCCEREGWKGWVAWGETERKRLTITLTNTHPSHTHSLTVQPTRSTLPHTSTACITLTLPLPQVPEMNEVASKAAEGGWKSALVILLFQNIGIFIGITSLFCLAYFQDSMVLT